MTATNLFVRCANCPTNDITKPCKCYAEELLDDGRPRRHWEFAPGLIACPPCEDEVKKPGQLASSEQMCVTCPECIELFPPVGNGITRARN